MRISASDSVLRYFGRWRIDGDKTCSGWNEPYFRFMMKGGCLRLCFAEETCIKVLIDDQESCFQNISGVLEIPVDNSEHSVKVTVELGNEAVFEWAEADSFFKYTSDCCNVQFIGDSITTAKGGFAYGVPEKYGVDYSVISLPGMALMDKAGWYHKQERWENKLDLDDLVGMESGYFFARRPDFAYVLEDGRYVQKNIMADLEADIPDVIVIALGTNDNQYINGLCGFKPIDYEKAYKGFLSKLKKLYPEAEIYVVRAFNNSDAPGTEDFTYLREATLNAYNAEKDERLHYIDTSDWDVEISEDWVHPTPAGYTSLIDYVGEAIKESFKKEV